MPLKSVLPAARFDTIMNSIMQSQRKELLRTAIKAARTAGEIILDNLNRISKDDIRIKQASDFVTRVDKESELAIIRTVREHFPHHCFLAEESLKDAETDEYRWIIDPLDGTTNYIHGYPVFSVSIALEWKKEIIMGVIFDPLRDELFTAERGAGASLNGHAIYVSSVSDLKDCLITTGFPFRRKELIEPYLKLFKNIFHKVSDLRRAGSAALDLAHLACGRCDGFFEIGLSPWDVAGGSLIVQEAGGVVTDFGGGPYYLSTGNIVAGNPDTHDELLKEVKMAFKGLIDR
jgi:myo-inositol-1(or 4)-monophosphatase